MNNDNVIAKCNPSAPFKNGSMVLGTTGRGGFQTRDVNVQPTGTFANANFSPSGSMPLSSILQNPGQTVYTKAAP